MADPRIKLLSPFDARLKKMSADPQHIPAPLVKAIIHGLLSHLWSGKRRRTKEMGIDQAKMEQMLFTYVSLAANQPVSVSLERLLQIFKTNVPKIFQACQGHSFLLLVGQSDLILPGLASYKTMTTYEKRLRWLKAEIPGFLAALKGWRPCTECRGNIRIPDDGTLFEWASTSHVGDLRNNIIARYHRRLSAATVKRILSSNPLKS